MSCNLPSHIFVLIWHREIRQIDSNLRQENTELKHRLRQLESRISSGDQSVVVGMIGRSYCRLFANI